MSPRIALVHALPDSIEPIESAMAEHWLEAERFHLLDESLAQDRARGGSDAELQARFDRLAEQALAARAGAILFTCSAFGAIIETIAARLAPLPVLKPYQGLFQALQHAPGPVGLIASFAPTLASITREFRPGCELITEHAAGALEALRAGVPADHDQRLADAAARAKDRGARLIALVQFSSARAQARVAAHAGLPVLTSPQLAVQALRARLHG